MSGHKVHKFQRNLINREVYMIRKGLKEIFCRSNTLLDVTWQRRIELHGGGGGGEGGGEYKKQN
jgi:hypothetical protein